MSTYLAFGRGHAVCQCRTDNGLCGGTVFYAEKCGDPCHADVLLRLANKEAPK